MAGVGWRSIAKVILQLVAGSFLLALVLLIPAGWWLSHIASEARDHVRLREYSLAVGDVSHARAAADACRVASWLPGPVLLHVVPGASKYRDGLAAGCDLLDVVAAMASQPDVRTAAASLDGTTSLSMLAMKPELVRTMSTAVRAQLPRLRRAAELVHVLNRAALPGSIGQRLRNADALMASDRLDNLEAIAAVGPSLLGLDRPRTFFVVLESPAEMRATGGFVGQYVIVRFSQGKANIVDAGTNDSLVSPSSQNPSVLPGSTTLFGSNNPEWANTNLTPHGPDAAVAWLRAWELMRGERLDGAIALDVVAAARLAAATGGVLTRPNGEQVTGAQALADYAMNGMYFEFKVDDPTANTQRKRFQVATLGRLLAHAAGSLAKFDALWHALPNSVREGRIVLYFAEPDLQRAIAASSLAHDIREHPGTVFVTFNNWAGNKFDYYQHLAGSARCTPGGADVQLRITNSADPSARYPAYVAQRLDDPAQTKPSVNDQFLMLLPTDGSLRWLSVDGAVASYQVVSLGGRPVVSLPLVTMAGERHVVRLGIAGTVTSLAVQGSLPVVVACGA